MSPWSVTDLELDAVSKKWRDTFVSRRSETVIHPKELQRTQEIQNILLLAGAQVVKVVFHGGSFAAVAVVGFNRGQKARAAAIVQEEHTLSQSPQRRRPELVSTRVALRDVVGQHRAHVVELQIGKRVHRSVGQISRRARCLRVALRRIVAGRAADGTEQRTTVGNRSGTYRFSIQYHSTLPRRSQQTHEVGKGRDVIQHGCRIRGRVARLRIAVVFRIAKTAQVQTAGWKSRSSHVSNVVFTRQRTVLREQQVSDAHLHVVSFTREDVQRSVLCLPAKTADGSVVAVVVEVSGNTKVVVEVGIPVGQQGRIVQVLQQPRAKQRRRNAEGQVVSRRRRRKARLLQAAASPAIKTTADRKQCFHSTVRVGCVHRAVRVEEERETGFTCRTSGRDERRRGIRRAAGDGLYAFVGLRLRYAIGAVSNHLKFRIVGWSGTANRRLRVASRTLVEVKPRSQTIGRAAVYRLHVLKTGQAVVEESNNTVRGVFLY